MNKYKVVLVGELDAGKTTLARYMCFNDFLDSTVSTVGAAYSHIKYDKNTSVELWDTSGQEKFANLTSLYYKNATIILLVFDCDNSRFENKLKFYLEEISNKVKEDNDYKIIIVCNKIDLVEKSNLNYLKKKINEIVDNSLSKDKVSYYIEISCKNKIGRETLIEKIIYFAQELQEKKSSYAITYNIDNYVNLEDTNQEKKCCY